MKEVSDRKKEVERYGVCTCNEDGGLYLNTGLIRQKNGFGGRGIIYPTYRLLF